MGCQEGLALLSVLEEGIVGVAAGGAEGERVCVGWGVGAVCGGGGGGGGGVGGMKQSC